VLTDVVAQRAAREMQRARLAVVPAAGHSVPGDNPDGFTAAVASFLDDIEHGMFRPAAAEDPPPLDERVEGYEQRRNRPGALPVVLAGLGALLAVGGAALLVRRAVSSRGRPVEPARAARLRSVRAGLGDIDVDRSVEAARQRAAVLATELAAISRNRAAARNAVGGVDVDRAREAAAETFSALSTSARAVPAVARQAVTRVEARRRAAKRGRRLPVGLLLTVATAVIQASRKQQRKRPKSARFTSLPWRS